LPRLSSPVSDFGRRANEPNELWGVVTNPLETGERQTIFITPDIRLRLVGLLDALTNPDSWYGTDDDIYTTVTIAHKIIAALYGALDMNIAIVRMAYPAGVGGGMSIAATWNIRNLTDLSGNADWCVLNGNGFDLEAGQYLVLVHSTVYGVRTHQVRLKYGDLYMYGSSGRNQQSNIMSSGESVLFRYLTLAAQTFCRIEHFTEVGGITNGLGHPTTSGVGEEVYCTGLFVKLSG